MSITIRPFDAARDTDTAAALLAERHARDRKRDPRLPASFDDAKICRGQIERAMEPSGWQGVVAENGGKPVGFAIIAPQFIEPTNMLASFFPARGVTLGYSSYATSDGMEYDVIREMFAVLADHFVSKGFFDYSVAAPATDPATCEAFTSLGFGRNLVCAIRDVAPVARAVAANAEMHLAAGEDIDVVHDLSEELTLHHARSPIFNPYIRESDTASVEFQKGLLTQPEMNAHWVAYDGGRPLGMNTFMAPFFLSPMTVPEKTVYLFQGIVTEDARVGGVGSAILAKGVAWAREQGYENVALHFASPNLSGAKFWQSSGFKPIEYGMRRHVDERIAWANK